MGRKSQQRQQQGANELLNFQFSTPVPHRQDSSVSANNFRNRGDNHGRNNRNHKQKNNRRRSAQDRASVRQKADSSMFPLHSSAEHTFLLSRRSPSKMNANEYSFHGSDRSVSWESVRMVHQRVPTCDDDLACPICLGEFVCARVTKCGHSFCLPCILRHAHTATRKNCPCCGVPLDVGEMRPVAVETVGPVVLQQTLRVRKLHRLKSSSAPFLPIPGAPQHANPHFAPTAGVDPDARYSRFNYLDPEAYHTSLVVNQGELQREWKTAMGSEEKLYLSLALEMVLEEQRRAEQESAEEKSLMVRFTRSSSGMYQPQSPALVYEDDNRNAPVTENGTDNTDANGSSSSKKESFPIRRNRENSVSSYTSIDTASTPCLHQYDGETDNTTSGKVQSPSGENRIARRKPRKKIHGSMYLDTSSAVHLYQAEDGQLVFLNGFNMTCLLSDFSKGPPSTESSPTSNEKEGQQDKRRGKNHSVKAGPLPDFLEGRILEKENVHLTSELRKRMPFLSHIPLFTDIVFVELDLYNILSEETRRKFKTEFTKRRKKRQSKVQAERRADQLAKKEDRDRINARKARLQTIDPDDEFFHAAVAVSEPTPEQPSPESVEFGPVLGRELLSSSNEIVHEAAVPGQTVDESFPSPSPPAPSSSISFSEAARRARAVEAFPALSSSESFPTLGSPPSSATAPRVGASTWRSEKLAASAAQNPRIGGCPPGGQIKKKKGPKIVLFSTGGTREY